MSVDVTFFALDHDDRLFIRLRTLEPGSPEWYGVRARIVDAYLPMVRSIASRFAGRGIPVDDLVQEGSVALISVVDRFDPERGVGFRRYAVPSVIGALKRYFRDLGWAVRPPRRLQQLRTEMKRVQTRLAQWLGHPPTPADIAAELGASVAEIHEALEADAAYDSLSLDHPVGREQDDRVLGDTLGGDDPEMSLLENRETLRRALNRIPPRERQILMMRFYGDFTQRQIAEEIGLSQMHVSRLLADSLSRLNRSFFADP